MAEQIEPCFYFFYNSNSCLHKIPTFYNEIKRVKVKKEPDRDQRAVHSTTDKQQIHRS